LTCLSTFQLQIISLVAIKEATRIQSSRSCSLLLMARHHALSLPSRVSNLTHNLLLILCIITLNQHFNKMSCSGQVLMIVAVQLTLVLQFRLSRRKQPQILALFPSMKRLKFCRSIRRLSVLKKRLRSR
jgi:hypothetical protein